MNVARREICGHEKQERISRNMQIEIDQAVCEEAATSYKTGGMQCGREGAIGLKQLAEKMIEKQSEKPGAAHASDYSRFSQGFQIIVVRMIDDFSVIQSFIGRINDL